MKVYGISKSGNCYKVKLLLEQLRADYLWHEVDAKSGETQSPAFLAINPRGQVPVLQIDANTSLAESNAILCYLADGTPFWPSDKLQRARVLQWLFFEQNRHEPNVMVARYIKKVLPADHPRQQDVPLLQERGYRALDAMEQHLTGKSYFVNDQYTIADIALYAFTHVAGEGGFDLRRYPYIQGWLARVQALQGYFPLPV